MDGSDCHFEIVSIRPLSMIKTAFERMRGQFLLWIGLSLVALILASQVPFGLLSGPMIGGMYLCYRQLLNGESPSFSTLFKGVNFFKPCLPSALILVNIPLLFLIPFYGLFLVLLLQGEAFLEANVVLVAVLFGLIILFLMAYMVLLVCLFSFTFPLIVERGLHWKAAMKLSYTASKANFWGMLKLSLFGYLLYFVALGLCLLPIIAAVPLLFGLAFEAYLMVFPRDSAPLEEELQ